MLAPIVTIVITTIVITIVTITITICYSPVHMGNMALNKVYFLISRDINILRK